ncbi:hypothetical protein B1218_36420, partial [Pseudomonas ogarae]
ERGDDGGVVWVRGAGARRVVGRRGRGVVGGGGWAGGGGRWTAVFGDGLDGGRASAAAGRGAASGGRSGGRAGGGGTRGCGGQHGAGV